nr:YkgJ family cysteine cluster protein [Desulfobulbaceae bacterium]
MRLCVTCAGKGTTCCEFRDILLSAGDLRRITDHTAAVDFFEQRVPLVAAYLDQDDDPNWNIYTLQLDGARRVVKHAQPASGACWFLTESGCRLPEDIRPLVCRLHPMEYTEERLTGLSPECPVDYLPTEETLLTNLEMDPAIAEVWRRQLYDELRTELWQRPKAA